MALDKKHVAGLKKVIRFYAPSNHPRTQTYLTSATSARLQVVAQEEQLQKLKEIDATLLNFGIKLNQSQLINLCINRCAVDSTLKEDSDKVIQNDRRRARFKKKNLSTESTNEA